MHAKNYISARLLARSLSFITLPIFTRLLLPSDYGIIAILTSFVAIFGIIYGLGIKGSIVRYYHEKTNDFHKFLGSTVMLLTIWSVVLSITLFFFQDQLLSFFNIPRSILQIGIGVVFFNVFFTIYQFYLQASKQSKKYAKINICIGVITTLLAIILVLQIEDNNYYGKAYAMLITAIGAGLFSVWRLASLLTVNFNLNYIKYALLFSLPIVFHHLARYILNAFDKVIINQIVGAAETGFYSIAYQVGSIQQMISYGLLLAWTPVFYEKLNKGAFTDISNLASKYARLVYINAFFLVLFAREIIMILAEKSYHEALNIVPVVVVSFVFIFLYSMYSGFAFYHKKTHVIAIFTILAGSVNVGLNYLLIPLYGYQVAAWTTLFSFGLLFLLHYWNVRFILKTEGLIKLKVLLPNFFILVGFTLFYSLIIKELQGFSLVIIKILLLASLTYVYFRKEVNKFFLD